MRIDVGDWTVCVTLDGDGHLNLYVTNSQSENLIEIETGQGDGQGEQLAFRVTTGELEREAKQ